MVPNKTGENNPTTHLIFFSPPLSLSSSQGIEMELPEEILAVLPEDPFAQLDLAKKITSIALSSRVTSLELEITSLQQELNEVNNLVDDMSDQLTCSEKEKVGWCLGLNLLK